MGLKLPWLIALLFAGTAVLLVLGSLLKAPTDLTVSISAGLPGGIIALSKATAVKVPRE